MNEMRTQYVNTYPHVRTSLKTRWVTALPGGSVERRVDHADDAPARGRATTKSTEWFTPAERVRWRVLAMGIDDDDGGGGSERRRDLDRRRDDADHQGRFGIVRGDHRGMVNLESDA